VFAGLFNKLVSQSAGMVRFVAPARFTNTVLRNRCSREWLREAPAG
jgi:hypothetical protein